MKWIVYIFICIYVLLLSHGITSAEVPVRISVKFILDENGLRPGSGNINTSEEVRDQRDLGNSILSDMISEHRIDLLEIVNVAGVPQHYYASISEDSRDNLRSDAMDNPPLYRWRNDAINVYINGDGGSAISKFPPDNDIIFVGQNIRPTTVLHEIGHSVNLMHTHEGGGDDGCADTIADNSKWNLNQLSQNNFGCLYTNCTASQKAAVDLVWFNVMSYHPARDRLSPCQMSRESKQADHDRNWLLTKLPIYVRSGWTGSQQGFYARPYSTLQAAVDAGGLSGKVIVLEQGSYNLNTPINADVEMITRSGTSTVSAPDMPLYTLPVLEQSESPGVRAAIESVKKADRDAIRASTDVKKTQHLNEAVYYLLETEKHASGDEKLAVQLELAQRYRHSGNCERAIKFYKLVADGTDQKYLRERALQLANECQEKLMKEKER